MMSTREALDKEIKQMFEDARPLSKDELKAFGKNPPITSGKTLSQKEDAEQSYLRTIRYWMDKVSEAQYHIRKNQKKIEDLYE